RERHRLRLASQVRARRRHRDRVSIRLRQCAVPAGRQAGMIQDLLKVVGPHTVAAAVKAKLLRRPTPLQIVYEVTHRCNLACEYCDRHTPLPAELELDQIVSILREFADLGTTGVTLDGGDPLVRPDIHAIVDELASLRMRIVINTNGILIPQKLETV